MKTMIWYVYRFTAWVVLSAIAMQFAAAGLLIFVGWRTPHFVIGTLLPLLGLVLVLLAVGAGVGRRAIGLSGLLLALLIAQHLILGIGQSVPWVRVFHIVVPVVLPGLSFALTRRMRPAGHFNSTDRLPAANISSTQP